ncbi:hypothetical protein BSKO_04427 [Bryopsis sp. KO-2023]|nr:hypothetical protein BSKO_04427 [Bryopsis sp. KO-2023]
MEGGSTRWRVLAVHCGPGTEASKDSPAERAYRAIDELSDHCVTGIEVKILHQPTLEELASSSKDFKPNLVYCFGGTEPSGDLLKGLLKPLLFKTTGDEAGENMYEGVDPQIFADLFTGLDLKALYLDCPVAPKLVDLLRRMELPCVIYWPAQSTSSSAVASQFAHAFMAMLRNPTATISESFALASRVVQMLCEGIIRESPDFQLVPQIMSSEESKLPDSSSVPPAEIPGIDFFDDGVPEVEGWEDVRLLAPKAELKLLVCGGATAIDAARLSYLGEALRALLLMEMRLLEVNSMNPCERVPSHLSPGCTAIQCMIRSASGAQATVVLGGPPTVLSNQKLVQHALRQTLVVDSLCLQFRLPPPGIPAPMARSSSAIAGGTPVVDALVVTSVWAVHILRSLCKDTSFRGLVSLGIAGVGATAVSNFKAGDTCRFNTIVTGMQNDALVPYANSMQEAPASQTLTSFNGGPALSANPVPASSASALASAGLNGNSGTPGSMDGMNADGDFDGITRSREQTFLPAPSISGKSYQSNRPPLTRCTEADFLDDLVNFLQERRGKMIDREKFPEAVLNGCKLDLYNLYKEVCSRGGFRVGNGINWKGQVFPRMRNWTMNHRMTGVGNALKRHYQGYLWEYEQVHPEDVTGDRCAICGGGDEVGTDWICCDSCEAWVHFACDPRPFLGSFKDYATGEGRTYHCPRCSETMKRQKVG